ncbi:YdcF family protein [Corynebacterium sp. P7003]|uniref:YdcF family protein n=1 Tax=Corynebacterium pygosceleis TaxID=2800406 RepID=A0ABT3WRH6_9CORY|nr:YdcF family protein [Corynebacterium pygosceleis]MCX7444776.1 YdcF family protein [Corynebacterium pygosceleis]
MTPPVADGPRLPVVILGCRLRDGRPGRALEQRLVAALPAVREHPSSPVVVTGYGEAPAMRDWLVDRGVDVTRILTEDRATSTNENLENTRELLADWPEWIVVTNEFHIPRVKLWAWHHGYRVRMVSARTPLKRIPHLWSREILALLHSALRIIWRRIRS